MDIQEFKDILDKGEGGLYKIPKPEPQLPDDMERWTMHPLAYKALLKKKQK